MKKYDVHVILNDKFHSVVIEADGISIKDGAYVFYKKTDELTDRCKDLISDASSPNNAAKIEREYVTDQFSWYPVNRTVIEPHNESKTPTGSAAWKR